MSGESAIVVAVVAVPAAVAAAVGAAAVGTFVAARAVTGAAGIGLSAVGRRMEHNYARHQERQAALAEWETAAREVVDRNARLAVLAARPGGTPGLPPPLTLQGQSVDQLKAWCTTTDQVFEGIERTLRAETASAVSAVLGSPTGTGTSGDAADAAIDAAGVLAAHRTAGTPPPAELVAACARVLDGLATDVATTDRAEVLAAVAQVHEHTTPEDQQSWLVELRVRVLQANRVAAQRRKQARTAATLMQALAESAESAELWSKLAEVVAEHRALDPELHREALAACERIRAERESSYVRDSLTRALEQLGYQVDQGFDTFTGQRARLRLVRERWPEHAVSVLVDGSELRAMVVRTESADGDDAQRLDTEREQQWCADFEQVRNQLADEGLRFDVQRLTPPGGRQMPIAARGSRRSVTRQGRRRQEDKNKRERDQ